MCETNRKYHALFVKNTGPNRTSNIFNRKKRIRTRPDHAEL